MTNKLEQDHFLSFFKSKETSNDNTIGTRNMRKQLMKKLSIKGGKNISPLIDMI
jgi:hypothetical protein